MFLLVFAFGILIYTPASVTLLSSNTNHKLSKNLLKDASRVLFKDCQDETGATMADIESLKMRKVPETKSGRCFLQCLFNTAKIMDDGKFNKLGMIIAFSPAMGGDLTKMGKLKELSEVCEHEIGVTPHENCIGAKLVVECVARNGKAFGIEFPRPKNINN